jgi:transposase
MIVIGVDAHKRTHTLVAADEVGRCCGEKTVLATPQGHQDAVAWARKWSERRFALEDCRTLTRRLESDLLSAGEHVVRVPTKLMAGVRRGARERGKSDPIDALAVARAALREPGLPIAVLDDRSRELRLLVDHREDLVRERTQVVSRLRWHLHELFPGLEIPARSLCHVKWLHELTDLLEGRESLVAVLARELLTRVIEITSRIGELLTMITDLVEQLAPTLLDLQGCGPLSAAKIVGEAAGIERFHSKAAFARWNGTAPVPVWSSNTARFRLSRSGNRQVNAALHRIAITQRRLEGLGREYVERRISTGATTTEALRLLRRRLSDEVFRRLRADISLRQIVTNEIEALVA